MSGLLLVVSTISLIVGGRGHYEPNVGLGAERTREIRPRMAVGARNHDILRQFLVEAVVLCLAGEGIGLLLGRGVSILVRWFAHWPTQASLTTIIAAVAVSGSVFIPPETRPDWTRSRLCATNKRLPIRDLGQ